MTATATTGLPPLAQRVLGSRLLASLTSPHGVDHYLRQVNPMWAATDVRAQVVDVKRETDGEHPVATLTLEPTSTWRGHRSGQYVQVGLEIDGRRTTRCFSISSAASLPGEQFTITVRAHEEGVVSKHLVREAQPGLILHLSQAEGDFTMHESAATPTNNHLVMISGGSGITPVMSHVRTLLRDGYDHHAQRKVTFVHYARSPEDQIFAEELAEIAANDNGVTVHLRYGPHLFDPEELRLMVGDFTDLDTWVCGPAGLVELVQEAYGDSPRLRLEFFKPPAFAREEDAEGTVAFNVAGSTAANDGSSLLEQAEAAGLTPEFGCRMGICFSCVSRKTEGTVRNILTGETSSLPDEDVRICVSAPVGSCAVDL
ncbi:ferredoxin reductase [Cytobacillus oceanisediminis]|uniref:ferredoxin reductase n=1 Tax=unclassified Aeromicrobium TaxID=2633570 RepID=UPI0006F1E635|nr:MULTISPECIES: ferredoxin reductase [unclassified Aeromicrobium]KQO38603.1 oxidoreductase [Aeromicrobium sp. Leaf245]KQP80060.1 oxidoreductase [Aeromicrobium sp. Leaf289]